MADPIEENIAALVRDSGSYTTWYTTWLPEGGTWQAGGCGLLARALTYSYPDARVLAICDRAGVVQHLGAQINGLVYDANGGHPVDGWVSHFADYEDLDAEALSVRPFDGIFETAGDIPTCASRALAIASNVFSLNDQRQGMNQLDALPPVDPTDRGRIVQDRTKAKTAVDLTVRNWTKEYPNEMDKRATSINRLEIDRSISDTAAYLERHAFYHDGRDRQNDMFGINDAVQTSVGNASVACRSVHDELSKLFPGWDPDQRWAIAEIVTRAAGVEESRFAHLPEFTPGAIDVVNDRDKPLPPGERAMIVKGRSDDGQLICQAGGGYEKVAASAFPFEPEVDAVVSVTRTADGRDFVAVPLEQENELVR